MSGGVALVTGGAKRIGLAIVRELVGAGYAVAIHCQESEADASVLAAEIIESGGRACVVPADLADMDATDAIVPQAAAALGPVNLLVNNASMFEPDDIRSFSNGLWEKTFSVNLRAPVVLASAMARLLPAGQTGAVINILDQRVLRPNPQFFSYTLTRSALYTATVTMAQALAPHIRVNAVAPGPTMQGSRQSPADFARQSEATLLGRGPTPREVAQAVLYLAEADAITGQTLAVDGGQHLLWRTADVDGIRE